LPGLIEKLLLFFVVHVAGMAVGNGAIGLGRMHSVKQEGGYRASDPDQGKFFKRRKWLWQG